MNETVLREQLQEAFDQLELHDPVERVMRRGNRVRRARRAPLIAAAAAAAGVGFVLFPGLSSPSAFAGWDSTPHQLSATDSAAVRASCQQDSREPLPPAAVVDARGDYVYTVYTDGVTAVDCSRYRSAGGWLEGGAGREKVSQTRKVAAASRPITVEAVTHLTLHQAQASGAWGWVSPAVASVKITADGYVTNATINQGVFAAWWPHEHSARTGGTVAAYDKTGTRIATIPLAPNG